MKWLTISFGLIAFCVACLFLWRLSDGRAERSAWSELLRRAGPVGPEFDPSVINGLPEPAQRYFRYSIAPGTPLVSVVEVEMEGQLGFGSRDEPKYEPMTARQVLLPPQGLVWRLDAGVISGSDVATPDTSWTRMWLLHVLPVVRISGNPDHRRSAFGRVVAEGAFWVLPSLLPGNNVSWTEIDESTARATVSFGDYSQSIDLTVDADGRPVRVVLQRWSNENSDRIYREQPFGGYLSDFREVNGYRLPMRVEGGNLIGTEDYFPFYKAEVRSIRFPQIIE